MQTIMTDFIFLIQAASFVNTRRPFQRFIELVEGNYFHQEPLDRIYSTPATNHKLWNTF